MVDVGGFQAKEGDSYSVKLPEEPLAAVNSSTVQTAMIPRVSALNAPKVWHMMSHNVCKLIERHLRYIRAVNC